MQKPKIFIGSSKESLGFARAIKSKIQDIAAVTVWDEIDFNLGRATLESLIELPPAFDFAILIFTSDDLTESRGIITPTPRDNIIFELGLFMGHLGRDRTFFVYSETDDLKIPSDLKGITYIPFKARNGDETAAVADACKRIRKQIKNHGVFKLFQSAAIINRIRMMSWEEIYARASKLVIQAESRVRATSFGQLSGLEDEKLEYIENLAKRAATQKNRHIDFIYKVVCSKDNTTLERNNTLRERKEVFDNYGVFDCLKAREIESGWGVDFLIVDDSHLHVSFQSFGNQSLKLGLELADAEDLVRPIARWYDECLFDKATWIDWSSL